MHIFLINVWLCVRGGLFVTKTTSKIRVHRLTRAAFISITHLCTCTKEHLVIASLHKIYPRAFFEQEVLRVLAELNAVEIARIACACITTRDFYSISNRAVLYMYACAYVRICIYVCMYVCMCNIKGEQMPNIYVYLLF